MCRNHKKQILERFISNIGIDKTFPELEDIFHLIFIRNKIQFVFMIEEHACTDSHIRFF